MGVFGEPKLMTPEEYDVIKSRLLLLESPIVIPEGYNKNCTCGSAVPTCPECAAVEYQWSVRKERFNATAAADIRKLIDYIDQLTVSNLVSSRYKEKR